MTLMQMALLAQFGQTYPLCAALPIFPVHTEEGESFREGYDSDDVLAFLGKERFALLMSGVKAVFCCAHRTWTETHADPTKAGAEVHCVYAADLEQFLKGGH